MERRSRNMLIITIIIIYTKGLVDLNSNGLTLADNGLIYRTAKDTHTAVTAIHKQLGKASQIVTMVPSDSVSNQ